MGEITSRAQVPPLATPEIIRLTTVMRNRLEAAGTTKTGEDRSSISSQNAPTEVERSSLSKRRAVLADSLTPRASDRDDVADAILEMFYAWPDTRRMDAQKSAAVASKYASVVSDMPLWAVTRACDQLTREDRDFPPSSGTLRAYVLKACLGTRDELTLLQRILTAEVFTRTKHADDAIDRVREVANSFKDRMPQDSPKASDYRQHPDADATRAVEEFDLRRDVKPIDHTTPVKASPSLLATLKRSEKV